MYIGKYNYNKLLGRIKEVLGNQEEYAKALGYNRATISLKLNNKSDFTRSDMEKTIGVLNIDPHEISDYFFCHEC